MTTNLDLFINAFNNVRALGFTESRRSNSTGIGKTLEDLIGVVENNATEADLYGFEIKSQRSLSESYVTLFTKAPTMPKRANNYLRTSYGSFDAQHTDIQVLHTSIFHGTYNTHIAGSRFSLQINNEEQRIYVLVQRSDGTLDNSVYYSFESIRRALSKLENLAYVSADHRTNEQGNEEFHFTSAIIFYDFISFENFLNLIENGTIMYDVRIGAYKTGEKRGKIHDHGSGFRIKKNDMQRLYRQSLTI